MPDSGTMTLTFLNASTGKNDKDYEDYSISGTLKWNSQSDLDCFSKGRVDWAYEHNLLYKRIKKRNIWGESFDQGLRAAGAYIDKNTASSDPAYTDLTFGVLQPDKLKAGQTYSYSYKVLLPKEPTVHFVSLAGQVAEKRCNKPDCVNILGARNVFADPPFIGWGNRWADRGKTCFSWTYKGKPKPCQSTKPSMPGPQGVGGGGGTAPTGTSPPTQGGGVPPGSVPETAGGLAHTWTNYTNAGGTEGPTIAAGQTVGIACKLQGFRVANGNTWWYRIAQSPWNSQFYVSADAFYNNGQTTGNLVGTPFVDNSVPDCAAPSPTYAETTGGIANTWTNYTNAGGTQGPTIPSNATIAIACKIQGFRVADGNTWWYRIAQSPWNNQFYVSADAFYNNGQTSGSLRGTPFVDPAVRDC